MERFTSIAFSNFKTFKQFSLVLASFNVLVGPNNAGKSTVITAFRILAEAMRKARSRNPELLRGPTGERFGYRVNLSGLPVAAENIFSDYDGSRPATIKFRISNGNHLLLYFPERENCLMFPETLHKPVRPTATFRTQFNCEVAFVPVLGPVEHDEPLYQKEAARLALISHRASRNFRNIWYHYPERFGEFRELLRKTWPGMDIEAPAIDRTAEKTRLHMFCTEDRIARELHFDMHELPGHGVTARRHAGTLQLPLKAVPVATRDSFVPFVFNPRREDVFVRRRRHHDSPARTSVRLPGV